MTPMFPLPFAARPFSLVMVSKVRVSWAMVIDGTFADDPLLLLEPPLLLPQAARTRPAVAISETAALFLVTAFKMNHLVCRHVCKQSGGGQAGLPARGTAATAAGLDRTIGAAELTRS